MLQNCKSLVAVPDAPPPGHVSLMPRNPADLSGWSAARGVSTHPFTQEIIDAIIGEVRRPK